MAGYGSDEEFQAWLASQGFVIPPGSPCAETLRQIGADYLDAAYGHHTHKDNRTTQADFTCTSCGFHQNADVVSAYNSAAWALGLGREHVPEVFTSKPLLSTA